MTKIAFMFPGQGSFEPGMGRRSPRPHPEAMAVYDEGSKASGLDLRRLCFSGTAEELMQTEVQQPTLVATSLAINAALRARGIAPRLRRRPFGRRVLGARRRRLDERRRGDRARARARPRDGRGREGAPRLDGRDPRPRRRGRRGALPQDRERVAGELQLPGPARDLRRDRRGRRGCSEAQLEGARRAIRLRVSGAFHSPFVEHAAERLRPAIDKIDFKVPTAQFVSTVTAKLEDVRRYRSLLVEQLTAPVRFTQAARELIGHGVDDVRRGRARQRAQRFTEAHRQLREDDPGQRPDVARRRRAASLAERGRAEDPFCSLEGKTALVTGGSRGIGRAIAAELARCRRGGRLRLSHRRRRGRRARRGDRRARGAGRRLLARGGCAARRGGRRPRHPRQQRRPHARRPARAHVRRRLARRDRDQPQLGLLHLPRGDAGR